MQKIVLKDKAKRVLELIVQGKKDTEIAEVLGCSFGTVRYYKDGLHKTFRTDKDGEMVYIAMKNGLLE